MPRGKYTFEIRTPDSTTEPAAPFMTAGEERPGHQPADQDTGRRIAGPHGSPLGGDTFSTQKKNENTNTVVNGLSSDQNHPRTEPLY